MDIEKTVERAFLVGLCADVYTTAENATDASMDELSELLMTAGGEEVARAIQNRHSPEAKTLIGKGKAEEIAQFVSENEITLVVFDNELSPAQTKNLEDIMKVRVIDRSALILDIFASRAQSREGKLQVELAQYKYILPRLAGGSTSLSRLGGGIGTRGPGETKLETDRRHIRNRISRLEEEINEVSRVRGEQRRARIKREVPLVALIGYTNAGKSTLLNTLTGSDIHAADRLFDTLDTTSRKFRISDTAEVILSDTVGFIRKLPHHLTKAFRATLEELLYADLILHVVDINNPDLVEHIEVTNEVISSLGADKIPKLLVYNKCDLVLNISDYARDENSVFISAKTGEGREELCRKICKALEKTERCATFTIPYDKAALLDLLHRESKVLSLEYVAEGALVEVIVDDRLYGRINRELGGGQNDEL